MWTNGVGSFLSGTEVQAPSIVAAPKSTQMPTSVGPTANESLRHISLLKVFILHKKVDVLDKALKSIRQFSRQLANFSYCSTYLAPLSRVKIPLVLDKRVYSKFYKGETKVL